MLKSQTITRETRKADVALTKSMGLPKSIPAPGSQFGVLVDFDDYAEIPERLEQLAHLLRAELRHAKTATMAHDAVLLLQDAMMRGVNLAEERVKRHRAKLRALRRENRKAGRGEGEGR